MNKRIFIVVMVMIALSVFSHAEGSQDEHGEDEQHHDELPHVDSVNLDGRKLRVAATTSIIGDVVGNVAGNAAEVTVLMDLGQNPHSYSPSPQQIAALERADLIFVNGLDLEEALMSILDAMEGAVVIPVSAGIEPIEGTVHDHEEDDHEEDDHEDGDHEEDDHEEDDHEEDDHEEDDHEEDDHEEDGQHAGGNPHFWFSPLNVIQWSETIKEALSAADPAGSEMYEASAQEYVAALKGLDREIRKAVSTIAPSDRKLVMDHSLADYYARDYGFEVFGSIVPSISDQAEPSVRELAELTDVVEKEKIKAIFVGETSGRGVMKLAESLAAEVGREVAVVDFLTGSLTEPGNRGDTYLDFVRYNTEQIVGALRGESP